MTHANAATASPRFQYLRTRNTLDARRLRGPGVAEGFALSLAGKGEREASCASGPGVGGETLAKCGAGDSPPMFLGSRSARPVGRTGFPLNQRSIGPRASGRYFVISILYSCGPATT